MISFERALAYYNTELNRSVKRFIVKATGLNLIILDFFESDEKRKEARAFAPACLYNLIQCLKIKLELQI